MVTRHPAAAHSPTRARARDQELVRPRPSAQCTAANNFWRPSNNWTGTELRRALTLSLWLYPTCTYPSIAPSLYHVAIYLGYRENKTLTPHTPDPQPRLCHCDLIWLNPLTLYPCILGAWAWSRAVRDQARAMPLTSLCSTSIPSFNAVLVLGVCVYVDLF